MQKQISSNSTLASKKSHSSNEPHSLYVYNKITPIHFASNFFFWYRIVLKNSCIFLVPYTYVKSYMWIYTNTRDKFNLVTSRFGKHLKMEKSAHSFFLLFSFHAKMFVIFATDITMLLFSTEARNRNLLSGFHLSFDNNIPK